MENLFIALLGAVVGAVITAIGTYFVLIKAFLKNLRLQLQNDAERSGLEILYELQVMMQRKANEIPGGHFNGLRGEEYEYLDQLEKEFTPVIAKIEVALPKSRKRQKLVMWLKDVLDEKNKFLSGDLNEESVKGFYKKVVEIKDSFSESIDLED